VWNNGRGSSNILHQGEVWLLSIATQESTAIGDAVLGPQVTGGDVYWTTDTEIMHSTGGSGSSLAQVKPELGALGNLLAFTIDENVIYLTAIFEGCAEWCTPQNMIIKVSKADGKVTKIPTRAPLSMPVRGAITLVHDASWLYFAGTDGVY